VWSVKCGVWSLSLECEARSVKCEVWSVRFGVWRKQWEVRSEKCEVWTVKCEVWSVKCGVWSFKFGVRRVQCEVWSVKCGVWSLKFGVQRVQCEVWSVKFEVWSAKSAVWSVKCGVWRLCFVSRWKNQTSREGHGRDRVSLNYRSFIFGKLPPPACPGLCYIYKYTSWFLSYIIQCIYNKIHIETTQNNKIWIYNNIYESSKQILRSISTGNIVYISSLTTIFLCKTRGNIQHCSLCYCGMRTISCSKKRHNAQLTTANPQPWFFSIQILEYEAL